MSLFNTKRFGAFGYFPDKIKTPEEDFQERRLESAELMVDPYGKGWVEKKIIGGGISEPVSKVLNLLSTNPERFKFHVSTEAYYTTYYADDIITGVQWGVSLREGIFFNCTQDWTTADERYALWNAIMEAEMDYQRQLRGMADKVSREWVSQLYEEKK